MSNIDAYILIFISAYRKHVDPSSKYLWGDITNIE